MVLERGALRRVLIGSTALALVAVTAPAFAADGGLGGSGDGGNGGNGGGTTFPGTAGTGGQGGPGAPGVASGQNGGDGGTPTGPGFAGGGGGGAASGNAVTSIGGRGGNGGNASFGTPGTGYGGGGGGGGGNGVDSVNFPTNDTPSLGGRGGNGGNAAGSSFGAGNGGAGGNGGYGAGVFTYSFTNVAGVTIGGGAGGNGGSGSGMQFSAGSVAGNGGAGGAGGAGIVGSIANIFNAGTITGGAGGQGGARGTTGVAGAAGAGAGGVGITGDFLNIVNSGTISGGLSGDGVTRANAITFTGGTNSLALQAGYSVVGNVQAASRADVLALSGTANASFNVASLGDTAQYRGFGTLQKAGSSTWELFGTSNFAGTLDIQGGTVALGALMNGANTIVRSGASLVGSGGIGSLDAQAGSIIAPGRGTDPGNSSSYGRLAVNGNLIFRQGSTYQVNVNTGTSDVIQATGSAVIEGGRVQVLAAQAANYARVTEYSIIRATSIAGQFSELTSDLAFVTPSLTYGTDRVNLVFTRNDVPVRSVATTANQAGVAAALESLGGRNQVLAAVLLQNQDGARAALNLLAGEAAASSTSAQVELMSIMTSMIMTSAFGNFGGLFSTGPAPWLAGAEVNADYAADIPGKPPGGTRMAIGNLDPKMYSMWGSAFGSFGSTSSNGNAGTLTRDVGGFVVGADATFDQMYRIGIAAGFARSSFDVRSRASSGETDTGFGAIYGGARFGPVTLRLGGLFAGMSSDTRRSIVFPGFADNVSARFGGTGLLGFGEVGYRFDVGTAGVEPFVGGSGMRLSRDGYTERGGPAALTVLQRDYDIQTFTAGVRASTPLWFDDAFTVRGQLAYRRAFGDVVPTALLAFAGGGTQFQTAGIPIDVNAVVAEAGIGWQATKDIALELAYTGQVGRRAEDHGVKGSMLWKF